MASTKPVPGATKVGTTTTRVLLKLIWITPSLVTHLFFSYHIDYYYFYLNILAYFLALTHAH